MTHDTPNAEIYTCSLQRLNTLVVDIVSSQALSLPAGITVSVALQDVSRLDTQAVTLAQSRVLCATAPHALALTLTYDAGHLNERNTYALLARIELAGQLLAINSQMPPFVQPAAGQRVAIEVDPIQRETVEGLHGGNLPQPPTPCIDLSHVPAEGLHGGNLPQPPTHCIDLSHAPAEGLHGGNGSDGPVDGIHGGNALK